jgi:glycosyltransferase involved in cell wall biosynthesis
MVSLRRMRRDPERPRVLIIVQNLPVPFDRRVWLECQTLVGAGYEVTVICPRGKETRKYQVIDGVTIRAYRPYAPGGGAAGFVLEYAYSFGATARLAFVARLHGRFDVIQACNPPDIFWPIARLFCFADASRFVFDHHDLCPELFQSRFPDGRPAALRGLEFLERATIHAADHVISTNASYAEVARRRGGKPSHQVTVVRTGPDPERCTPVTPAPELRRGRKHLVAYLGVMGPQDGVDIVVAAADAIVHQLGRTDVSFTLMGAGDCLEELISRRDMLGLQGVVEFLGRVSDETVAEVLSTADVGLCPDPLTPLNDVSTMNKTMEYMAFGLPVLAFDLKETRVSAADAAGYVKPNEVTAYAQALLDLLDAEGLRAEMGRRGRGRVETELAWKFQRGGYLAVFNRLIGRRIALPQPEIVTLPGPAEDAAVPMGS